MSSVNKAATLRHRSPVPQLPPPNYTGTCCNAVAEIGIIMEGGPLLFFHHSLNKETGCSSINGTSTNNGPVKRKLQGRRITTVPVSDYESDEIELDTDYDVSGVLSIFTDSESDVEKKTKSVKIMLKAHSYMVFTYEEELWPGKVLEVKNNGAVVSCIKLRAHVLGSCPHGEVLRNSRHHRIRSMIAEQFRSINFQVFEEVHGLADNGSTRRIDIIAIPPNNNNGYIIDPTVRFEKQKSQPEDRNNINYKAETIAAQKRPRITTFLETAFVLLQEELRHVERT
ncbi:hypothetical protein ANN_23144 [Periplaneta americana]|uniref:Uncharacterized protein n=1 Tax=Periplaneta americana TaxID=6978 RepID=A0ABQ8SLI3_PERAM|nr:hypothetical protein ANN_23144 [Periplaneta americana]